MIKFKTIQFPSTLNGSEPIFVQVASWKHVTDFKGAVGTNRGE